MKHDTSFIAYKGEEIRDSSGAVIATVAADIHSGGIPPKPSQFIMAEGYEHKGGFLRDEIMDFVRSRLTRGAPARAEAPAQKPSKKPASNRAKKAKR